MCDVDKIKCCQSGCVNICTHVVKFPEGGNYRLCRRHAAVMLDSMSSLSIPEPYTITILPMKFA